jgi:DNA-binding NtrC family response regulator
MRFSMLRRSNAGRQAFRQDILTSALGKIPASSVLIVDDEGLMRWSLAETLEQDGYRVAGAGDAREALEFVRSRPGGVCVVLLDLRLPDSRDLGLLRTIRRLAPRCRVILMTAFATPEIVEEARQAGAFQVLAKPFDMSTMLGLVRQATAVPA